MTHVHAAQVRNINNVVANNSQNPCKSRFYEGFVIQILKDFKSISYKIDNKYKNYVERNKN